MERDMILSRLLDKYEKSKHLLEPNISNRRVMLRVEKKELPEYKYQDAEVRDAFNRAAEELERGGYISVEWVKGRPVFSAIVLNLEAADQCYRLVGRLHPRERAELVAGQVQAALASVETPWIAIWRDVVCTKARSAYAVPHYCKENLDLLSALLTALAEFDSLRGSSITMRAFSSRCYHDSKFFEREVLETFLGIARKYHPELAEVCEHEELGVRDKLAYLGIYARPELYELSGRCVLVTETGGIDVYAVRPYGVALPSTAVDCIRSIDLNRIHKIVFIENKTNYDEYLLSELEADTLAVYHGGFLSPQKRKLFSKIAEAISGEVQAFFWADIDLGGFQMFSRLQKLIPALRPMRMTGHDVRTHHKDGLKRPEEYLKRLEQAHFSQAYPLFDDAIQEILHYGVTIEQETFLAYK